jgi:RimJ/RimL family protein N-acetyltransferase
LLRKEVRAMTELIYPARHRAGLNPDLALRDLDLDTDIAILHPWYQLDYASFWNMQNMTPEATRAFYADAVASGAMQAYMGFYRGEPTFVVERYEPRLDEVSTCYEVLDGDVGMHFFVAPSRVPIRHFTRDVLRVVMAFMFDHCQAKRVVVEPDIRNTKVHRLNHQVGFVDSAVIQLSWKTAQLSFCTASDFAQLLEG